MTETSAKRGSDRADKSRDGNAISRLFGAISLFVRQILDELRKVVRPTGPELVRYTTVVVVFVVVMMALVSVLDFGFTRLVSWVFAGSRLVEAPAGALPGRQMSPPAAAAGPPARK